MRGMTFLLLASALLQGCATHTGRQCEDNFTTEGSFLTGKAFTTYVNMPATPYAVAFKNASQTLAKEGFFVQSADVKTGVLSAYQNVALSQRTAPLNLLVTKQGAGSKVEVKFVAAAGMFTPEGGARSEFCKYTDQIGK